VAHSIENRVLTISRHDCRMQDAARQYAAIRAGHHAALYRLLLDGAAEGRLLPPGTEGAIGRAEACYDGNPEATALLHEMNLAVFRLRQFRFTGDEAACRDQREALARLAGKWFYHAPLHHVAALLPPEGEA
jgi:hypothetical protein